jgi:hypothetical protein
MGIASATLKYLSAAQLDREGRLWLTQTLEMLGYHSWAELVRQRQGS